MAAFSKMILWLKNFFIRIKNSCFAFFSITSKSDESIAAYSAELLNNKEFNRVLGASPYYYPILKRGKDFGIKEEELRNENKLDKPTYSSDDEPYLDEPRYHRMGSGLGINV